MLARQSLVTEELRRAVVVWLGAVCAFVLLMVVVGGITRLTGSGLSIVEWKPLVGAVPPLSDHDWDEAFRRYQQFPQYKLLASSMTLAEFKRIFFWEYLHRLLGRVLGVVFFAPLVYFAAKRAFTRELSLRLLGVLALGAMQGAMGWLMVKSGLVDIPRVSHYRLAAHLSLALLVLGFVFWLLLDVRAAGVTCAPSAPPRVRKALRVTLAVLAAQIVYGALTAGLHAGVGYNTFPKMHGRWIPLEAVALTPLWRNAVENHATVQLLHRAIGTLLLVAVAATWALARSARLETAQRRAIDLLLAAVVVQFSLGVATLVLVVPLTLAALHQLGACVLFLLAIRAVHAASARPYA